MTVYEGGVRVPAFINSPLLGAAAGSVTNELFHISDWFPTILSWSHQVSQDIPLLRRQTHLPYLPGQGHSFYKEGSDWIKTSL